VEKRDARVVATRHGCSHLSTATIARLIARFNRPPWSAAASRPGQHGQRLQAEHTSSILVSSSLMRGCFLVATKSAVREQSQQGGLYERDFEAWAFEQACLLRQGRFAELDVRNLAEEVEDMGRSEARALRSELSQLLAHLLKLRCSPRPDPRNHWVEELALHRLNVQDLLAESPGLKARLDTLFAGAWNRARVLALRSLERDGVSELPSDNPFTLDEALDLDFLP
jgi:hypothetical protein